MEYDGGVSSGNEQYVSAEKRRPCRHTTQQIEKLDAYFKTCPHLKKTQRLSLGRELNMKPDQVKFWFQNKRTQNKTKDERSSNILLHGENEKLRQENEAMREVLKNVVCPPCGGPPLGDERERSLQTLRLQNARLKERRAQLVNFVSKNQQRDRSTMMDPSAYGHRQQIYHTSFPYEADPRTHFHLPSSLAPPTSQTFQPHALSHMDIEKYSETVASAVEELRVLFSNEKDFWVKSSVNEEHMINEESYQKFFRATRHFRNSGARIESSKASALVSIEATNLIEMFLDSEKRKSLFPTIVNDAKTKHVFGSSLRVKENCNVVQVIEEKLHILSPLVEPREFKIVRCCQQIKKGLWIIVDVSDNSVNDDLVNVLYYKRPSGCLIQAFSNDHSKVTWIEHVEVDGKSITHPMYKDILFSHSGYGAKRWIVTLERMCERMVQSSVPTIPSTDWLDDTMPEKGRRCVLKLAERMLKLYNEMLIMSGKIGFPQQSKCGLRISVRLNDMDGQPPSFVLCGATCISIPLTPLQVFNTLTRPATRHQWDVLCHEYPVTEIASFFAGARDTNRVTILKPTQTENLGMFMMSKYSDQNDMLMLQECFMDALGGMIVYAPLDQNTLDITVSGEVEACRIPIFPSGFILSNDGRGGDVGATLLTVVFQILVSGPTKVSELSDKSVNSMASLVSTTVQRVKAMFLTPPTPPHQV